jgi:large subunit ribosomal protein L32e
MQKKRHPKFNIPNYGTKSRSRVPDRWRKQRGIDNKKRIKKDFMGAEPTIGYKNPDALRGIRASGRRILLIHNPEQLSRMIGTIKADETEITIGTSVSVRKRIAITELAKSHKINVTNGAYK